MEILPTLTLLPPAPTAGSTPAESGGDPFLALLAGLMQQPAQPAVPLVAALEAAPIVAAAVPAELCR